MSQTPHVPVPMPSMRRVNARALHVGDRIDTAGLERSDMISAAPLAFRHGEAGFVAIFRYGVVVLIGLSPLEEDEVLRGLTPRVSVATKNRDNASRDEETITVELASEREEQVPPGGPVYLRQVTPEHLLIIADALAKSTALARDEREVTRVFDVVEPVSRELAGKGRTPARRKQILQTIGQCLLVQQRLSGRVAAEDKPDVLWDRPDLERLHARLQDEFELPERAEALHRKLSVLSATATALTDLIDTRRSLRLEATIVLLIVFEIFITFYQMWTGTGGH
jgi:uncharacterized Rmd1/YagE family protein